jgi:flagellin-like hook-associated protein FlgL
VAFTDTLGVSGRDLNPALHLGARLSDLFGGQGLTLETDALGTQRLPQGLRITNGSFTAAINLEPLVSDPNATLNDLKKAIERAGVHVEMRLTPTGIQLASQLSGTPLKVESHNGTLATQLGLDTTAPTGRVDDLNNGLGVDRIAGTDFTLTLPNGHVVNVDIGEASTTAAIAEAINAAQSNVNPSGTPPSYFTASTFRQRTFESMPVAAPDAALSFNVSFNGEPAQAISIGASGGRTLDQLATEMQTQLNAAARRAGLDGYDVRVAPDAGDTFLQFTVEDSAGVARIAFAGGSTGTLGLGGQLDGNFESRLRGEVVTDRLAIRDNTWTTGAPQSLLSGFGGAATADNLGLLNSFDPVTGRFVSADLKHRGQGDTGLFATLADLTSALQGNSQAAIARQIDRVEAAYQKMLDARGETGARAQRAQLAQSRLTAESEQVTIMASNVMDTDIAAAAQQFQQTQVVLQAGLSATAAIGQLSLFDYL